METPTMVDNRCHRLGIHAGIYLNVYRMAETAFKAKRNFKFTTFDCPTDEQQQQRQHKVS